MNRTQIEALQVLLEDAGRIHKALALSETKSEFIDPSFDLARSEALDAAHKLTRWLEDLVFVARTLMPDGSPVIAGTGAMCEECGMAMAPQSGPGRPRKYCTPRCTKAANTKRMRKARA